MLTRTWVAIALTLLAASPSWAVTTVIGGHHIIAGPGEQTFPIIATSDSGEMSPRPFFSLKSGHGLH